MLGFQSSEVHEPQQLSTRLREWLLLLFYLIIMPQRHRLLFNAINEFESALLAGAVRGPNDVQK
jgi:hypothetical protein